MTTKLKRFPINGKMLWYYTNDGGLSWYRISVKEAMKIIDWNGGVVIN